MKIIDAVWEKRNLGVSCVEIEIEKNDNAKSVIEEIRKRTERYQVIKNCIGRTDISIAVQNEGFYYIETLFETGRKLNGRPEPPEICKPFVKNIDYHIATDSEEQHVLEEINRGDIFSTDRIALDPEFSRQLAGRRYALWMKDVLSDNRAYMVISSYKGENIGFNIYVDKGSYYDMLLGGLFYDWLESGLGFVNSYSGIMSAYEQGARRLKSHVSSNNFTMLKLHLLFGLHIHSMTSNYIKHNN